MTARQFVEAVAKEVDGVVNEVEKANGVIKMGITFPKENGISPCIYVDDMYEDGFTVGEATEEVLRLKEANDNVTFDPNTLREYENAKQFLTLRLYNQKCNYSVAESAERYGFDDLIIVPVLDLDRVFPNGSVRVKADLIKSWGVSEEQVFADARDNIKADDYFIKTMAEVLGEMMSDVEISEDEDVPMYVISNKKKTFGAYGVIVLADELKARFPEGYTVIPSSLHEVIVTMRVEDASELTGIIGEVNDTQLATEEQLGYKPYFIAA